MGCRGRTYGNAASASLNQAAKALDSYLLGRVSLQHLLGCMYAAAPGRRGFMQQAQKAFFSSDSPIGEDSNASTRPLASQLVSFAALVSRALGVPPGGQSTEGTPRPVKQPEETIYAGLCSAEFWLQHVQQLLSLEAAAATVGDTDTNADTAPVHREMEDLIRPISAAAADAKVCIGIDGLGADPSQPRQ